MRATYLHLGVAGLGFGALVSQHVAPGPAFGASLAVFVVLCGALYHRRAGWVSALLGTTFALAAAAAVAYFFFGVLAACGAGLAAGALAVHTYLRILRRSGLAP